MNRTVVISSDNNPDYLFFLPIVSWAWRKLGWEVITVSPKINSQICDLVCANIDNYALFFDPINEYRIETQVQCMRLYVANWVHESYYLMTTDADMLPLSDYWNPDYTKFTSWGRDLTNYHNPICYLGAPAPIWKEVMQLTGNTMKDMIRDFEIHHGSKSDHWETWWQIDQDIITERLLKYPYVRQDRGIAPNSGFPAGRIDRGAWDVTLYQPLRIDAHLLRPGYSKENWPRIMNLIKDCFDISSEDREWMEEYRINFLKLINHD
jgi:hypothetical protein